MIVLLLLVAMFNLLMPTAPANETSATARLVTIGAGAYRSLSPRRTAGRQVIAAYSGTTRQRRATFRRSQRQQYR
jgi:hypothetical protein